VVSLGLAAAAAAAANLIAHIPSPGWNCFILLLLLVGGVLGVVVGYAGPMVGAFALPPAIPVMQDLIPPLLLGVSEFLVFGPFLSTFTARSDIGPALKLWFIATGIYGMSAFAIILRARYLLAKSRDGYDDKVLPTLNRYLAYMTLTFTGPAMLVILTVLGELSWLIFGSKLVVTIFLVLIVADYAFGFGFHNVQARPWKALLAGEEEPEAPRFVRKRVATIQRRVQLGELDGRYFLPARRLKRLRSRLTAQARDLV